MNRYKIIYVISILLTFGCIKEPTFEHSEINFSFADSIPGTYTGTKIINTGPPNFTEYVSTFSVIVTDNRTTKECKFFVDLFNEQILLLQDGTFSTSWNFYPVEPSNASVWLSSKFSNDTLYLEENYYSKMLNYTTYSFVGVRQ